MTRRARVRELMLGIEGLALLRTAADGDAAALDARVAEIRSLVEPGSPLPPDDPPIVELDAPAGYAAWAGTYDSLPNFILAAEEPCVAAILADRSPGQALDAACGTGRHTATLARHGHDVLGVDQSPDMLAQAAAKVPDARFKVGDLTALPLPDDAVDLAVCALALTHQRTLGPAVAELCRVVRPGGDLIVTDVHPMLVLLDGQPVFAHPDGRLAFVRNHVHLVGDYLAAFAAQRATVVSCQEPRFAGPLPPGGYAERIPEAAHAAWAGLPVALVWHLRVG